MGHLSHDFAPYYSLLSPLPSKIPHFEALYASEVVLVWHKSWDRIDIFFLLQQELYIAVLLNCNNDCSSFYCSPELLFLCAATVCPLLALGETSSEVRSASYIF